MSFFYTRDALAAGVTFAFLEVKIIPAIGLIGVITFVFSVLFRWSILESGGKIREENIMADSNITKQALAAAFRELMEEESFNKIQVAHICERCNMNRKSFYYHFKDKYDCLNWIFDTEIISFIQKYAGAEKLDQRMDIIREVCNYFYENRSFYRKALKIKGQNSFSEHFGEYIIPILKIRLTELMGESTDDFALNFLADAAVCTLERWLLDKDCMPPDEFTDKLFHLFQQGVHALQREFQQDM